MNDKENMIDKLYENIVYNNLDAIKQLVTDGVDIHYNNDKAFLIACYFGNVEIIDYFLSNGADINTTATVFSNKDDKYYFFGNGLSLTVDNRMWEAFDYLLEKGIKVDLNDSLALGRVLFKKEFDRAKTLIKMGADVDQCNVLIGAGLQSQWNIVKFLVNETNADIHTREDYILRLACYNKNYELVKLLVEKGANINAIPSYKEDEYDSFAHNETALTYSVLKNDSAIFSYLMMNGADPNINGQEPFIQACYQLEKNPYVESFIKHYIREQYVVFNDTIFYTLVATNNFGLLKELLDSYPKKEVDPKDLLQQKSIYQFDRVYFFEYLLNNGYEIKDSTRKMLEEEKKDNFLQVLLNYDLRKDLPNQNTVTKKVKI